MIPKFEREGYWWAKWIKTDPGIRDADENLDGGFEPVEVCANCMDPDSKEQWRVAVLGVEKSQSPENFEWGEPIAPRRI